MAKWNRRSLLSSCEALLSRDDCQLRIRTITDDQTTAKCSFMWKDGQASDIRLTVDPAKGGLVESFLHEALHVVLAQDLGERFSTALDEVLVHALERELWIKLRKNDLARWKHLITKKL